MKESYTFHFAFDEKKGQLFFLRREEEEGWKKSQKV